MEIESVKVSRDNGAKKQWATGVFYRKEGRKWTVKSKAVSWALVAIFGVSLVVVLLQPSETGSLVNAQPSSRFKIDDSRFIATHSSTNSSPGISANGEFLNLQNFSFDHNRQSQRKRSAVGRAAKPSSRRRTNSEASSQSTGSLEPGLARFDRPPVDIDISEIHVPLGTVVKAKLLTNGSAGLAKAKILENVTHDGDELIPNGAILLGKAGVAADRIQIDFHRSISSSHRRAKISAYACDSKDGGKGIAFSRWKQRGLSVAASIGLNFLSGVSVGMQDTQVDQGVEKRSTSMRNALLNGASSASLEGARQTVSNIKSKGVSPTVPIGTMICVVFNSNDSNSTEFTRQHSRRHSRGHSKRQSDLGSRGDIYAKEGEPSDGN